MYQMKSKYVAVLTMNNDSKGENVKKHTKNSLERKQVTNLFLFKKKQKGGCVKLFFRN